MKKNLSLVRTLVLALVLTFAAPLLLPAAPSATVEAATAVAPAVPAASGGCAAGFTSSPGGLCIPHTDLPNTSIQDILLNLMNWLFGIFAFLAIISFIIAGIQYFLAAGNPESAKKAKSHMVYSIIGVVVALSSLVVIYAVEGFLIADNSF